jgi:D-alanyl-D-alanine endopeptidase (penicillin-binding protein 7)
MERGPHSFDMRGLKFAAKFLLVLVFMFMAVRYGTAIASDRILTANEDDIVATETKLLQAVERRENRPEDEKAVLQKLQAFERELSTRTIGTASIDTLALAHERMIAADLTEMKLYLFENGHATATYPILSKGKRGSRWETPTGLYKIETKEKNHFSSIGLVDMPYSMQFFGNFFVHGWPTYPDGTPVPEGYSGGCIRLSTEDAAQVFEFVKRGTPIFVSENSTTTTPISVKNLPVPKTSAKAFIVADINTGTVYAEKAADAIYPIASVSKLLTALVANETIHFDRTLTVNGDDRAQTDGTPGSIFKGDTFTVGELLYPLLMESNNSAAYTLARYNGQDNFVEWMNDKAEAIGMENTNMEDPSGISPNNTSTASDLFKLTRYIAQNQSFILNLSREPEKKMKAENGRTYNFANFNLFMSNPQFLGGKVGYTPEAHETMTTVWELPVQNATATIAIIVLRSDDRRTDVQNLLSWFKRAATTTAASR